jgi:pimeloyl-ACP methyl ester carboxylesterase
VAVPRDATRAQFIPSNLEIHLEGPTRFTSDTLFFRGGRRMLRRMVVRRMVVIGIVALGMTAGAAEPPSPGKSSGPSASRSGYLPINGLKLYYEVYGELGRTKPAPLLLIPGAFLATDSMKPWAAAFAAKRSVIVFDQQGHGRTADTSRKMSYEQFGDDAAALLRALKVERADVMGYSQGGGVALQLAVRHPTLVNKLVTVSATYRKDGWYPAVSKAIEGMNAKELVGSPIEGAFKKHTPDPKAFEAYVAKIKTLNGNDQNITDAQMRAISAKTMVIVGDADGVRPEHAVAMFRLRGGGDEEAATTGMLKKVPAARLVILPATSHIAMSGEAKVLEAMVTPFLEDAPPANPALW